MFHQTVERIHVGKKFGDIPRGIFIVRGENVVLLGEIVSGTHAHAHAHLESATHGRLLFVWWATIIITNIHVVITPTNIITNILVVITPTIIITTIHVVIILNAVIIMLIFLGS